MEKKASSNQRDAAVQKPQIVEGAYFRDLLGQPEALRATREGLSELSLDAALLESWRGGRIRRVILTGMGSSLHALYPLHRSLCAAGANSHWIETAELLHGMEALQRRDTLLVAVSQSGESAETVQLMRHAADFGHVVAVTNNERSTLGRAAGSRVLLKAGTESTVSCKTYIATLAGLHMLGAALGGSSVSDALHELDQAEAAVKEYLSRWRAHVSEWAPLISGIRSVFVTGRGASLATAGTGGLILKESTRQPAEGMSAAAFRHGPLEMADERALVLVFEGDESVAALNRRLVVDVTEGGGRAVLISTQASGVLRLPPVPTAVRPIVEILPVQMLSLAIAAREGNEAGYFMRATKITNVA